MALTGRGVKHNTERKVREFVVLCVCVSEHVSGTTQTFDLIWTHMLCTATGGRKMLPLRQGVESWRWHQYSLSHNKPLIQTSILLTGGRKMLPLHRGGGIMEVASALRGAAGSEDQQVRVFRESNRIKIRR